MLNFITSDFALFQWTATILGSDREQFGVIVGLIVVAAILAEKFLFSNSFAVNLMLISDLIGRN